MIHKQFETEEAESGKFRNKFTLPYLKK